MHVNFFYNFGLNSLYTTILFISDWKVTLAISRNWNAGTEKFEEGIAAYVNLQYETT